MTGVGTHYVPAGFLMHTWPDMYVFALLSGKTISVLDGISKDVQVIQMVALCCRQWVLILIQPGEVSTNRAYDLIKIRLNMRKKVSSEPVDQTGIHQL